MNEKIKKMSKIIKIKMMCNWMSGTELCNYWNKFTDGNHTYSKNDISIKIYGEELSLEDADFIVVVNNTNDYIITNENLSKTIFMKMEPIFYSNFWKNINSRFLKAKIVHGNDFEENENTSSKLIKCNPFEWFISKTRTELLSSNYSKNKNKENRISSILSGKQIDEGHKIRIKFALYAQNFFNWDNYGNYNSDKLPWNNFCGLVKNKEDALIPYKYSFNVENNFIEGFVGEKLLDCILCETLCFYYGCPNVDKFINPNAFVQLDLGREDNSEFEQTEKWNIAIDVIKKAIEENLWEKRLFHIKNEKKRILEETNLCSKIFNIITES